jgi:hypothetical protein
MANTKHSLTEETTAVELFLALFFNNVQSRKQKLATLYIQIACQAVQSSAEFYDFL